LICAWQRRWMWMPWRVGCKCDRPFWKGTYKGQSLTLQKGTHRWVGHADRLMQDCEVSSNLGEHEWVLALEDEWDDVRPCVPCCCRSWSGTRGCTSTCRCST
jgi:hypothetical protein